jgi:hypothetical protein
MQYPNDSRRCLTVLDQDSTLMAVIEMSLSSWSGLRVVLRSLPIYAQGVASRGPLSARRAATTHMLPPGLFKIRKLG